MSEEKTAEAMEKEENPLYLKFKKPFEWEGERYEGIDLSGFDDISAKDLIQIQRTMERAGSVTTVPEVTIEYAGLFASKATGKPVEFFNAMPSKDSIQLKNKITNFLYGEE